MYTIYKTGPEKFIGTEGVALWQDYNKITFLWPGVSAPFSAPPTQTKKKSSNKPATGLLFVAGTEDYASGLLLQFS